MRFAVIGLGAVGARTARQLLSTPGVDHVVVREHQRKRRDLVVRSLGERALVDNDSYSQPLDADVAILAGPTGTHVDQARSHLSRGIPVVSVADSMTDVRGLLELDSEASRNDVPLIVGAGFSPGLTCVLAMHAAARVDAVDEIHVAKVGTGGPACARQHHRALGRMALDWRDGEWVQRAPGSGRELCWFPDPIGARDCYRASLADSLLLQPAFPDVQRVTARMAATRRDRLTARLPMLWPTDSEGGPGAIRVEVRGRRGTVRETIVLGVMDRAAVASAAVASLAAIWACEHRLRRNGAAGLAQMVESIPFLAELSKRGIKAAAFEGHAARTGLGR